MTVRVKCEKKIKTIILWSPTQQLIEQANNQKYSQKYNNQKCAREMRRNNNTMKE